MTVVGQEIIYSIRKDLFEHLQKLPFQFYDDRPHGKILTRVINYVNSVSDALSNAKDKFIVNSLASGKQELRLKLNPEPKTDKNVITKSKEAAK